MPLINKEDQEYLRKEFDEKLKEEINILVFTEETDCQYCNETKQIIEELSSLSNKIKTEFYSLTENKEKANKYKIDKTPAIVLLGKKDYGIRFFGIPSGYEFTTLVKTIIRVSRGESELTPESKEKLKKINKNVHIKVFITPTCPYCPLAVEKAHQIAIENDKVTSEMIESMEFPQLAQQYGVMAVPKVVINEKISFEGAVPEPYFVDKILLAL